MILFTVRCFAGWPVPQRVEGFVCSPWLSGEKGNFLSDMAGWIKSGTVVTEETVFEGIAEWPNAFQVRPSPPFSLCSAARQSASHLCFDAVTDLVAAVVALHRGQHRQSGYQCGRRLIKKT